MKASERDSRKVIPPKAGIQENFSKGRKPMHRFSSVARGRRAGSAKTSRLNVGGGKMVKQSWVVGEKHNLCLINLKIVSTILYFLLSTASYACSCRGPYGFVDVAKKRNFVFRGVVTGFSIEKNKWGERGKVEVEVKQVWKGKYDKETISVVGDVKDIDSCAVPISKDDFEIGDEYLFSAFEIYADTISPTFCGSSSVKIEGGMVHGTKRKGPFPFIRDQYEYVNFKLSVPQVKKIILGRSFKPGT